MLELNVLVDDSLESSHPISVEVNDPKEINSLFDSISYSKVLNPYIIYLNLFQINKLRLKKSKGASIIRMMNAFLTEKTFKKGVSVRKKTTA